MKVGLVGFSGSGKTTVFNALTGLTAETGFGATRGKTNLGAVKVPDERVLALAGLYKPKKTTFAEISFCDVAAAAAGSQGQSLDEATLRAMREVDALCQVVRGFPGAAGEPAEPLTEAKNLEDEMNLADLILIEKRLERIRKEKGKDTEIQLLERVKAGLEAGTPLRSLEGVGAEEWVSLSGYRFLTQKPLLVVLNGGSCGPCQGRWPWAGGAGRPGGDGHRPDGARGPEGVRRLAGSLRTGGGPLHPRGLRAHRPDQLPHRRRGRVPGLADPPRAQRPQGRRQDPQRHRARLHPRRGGALG
jgi:hypothetical protein